MKPQRNQMIAAAGRQFFGIAFLCCFGIGIAQAQPVWDVTQLDLSGYYPQCVSCYGNTCTACTEKWDSDSGAILTVFWRTDDAGRTWKQQDLGLPLKSLPQPFPPPHAFPVTRGLLHSIDQIDSLRAIAVGDSGLIVLTFDGGETWIRVSCPVTSDLLDVHCARFQEGIIVGLNPPRILILENEGGWRVAPFVPSVLPDGPLADGYSNVFCHSYGGKKYRVLSKGFSSDSLATTRVQLYTTLNSWGTMDSASVPLLSGDTSCTYPGLQCSMGQNDTIVAAGRRRPWDSGGTTPGVLVRSFDGGSHWQTFVDSASQLRGYSNLSPINHGTIISLASTTSGYNGYCDMLWSSDLGSSWRIDTLLFNTDVGAIVLGGWASFKTAFTSEGSIIAAFYVGRGDGSSTTFLARLGALSVARVEARTDAIEDLDVYPNPATNSLQVAGIYGPLTICDPLGRQYYVPKSENALDISRLPAGVYYVSDGTRRARFVKE